MLSEEQIKEVKEQLVNHIEKSFPEDKKQFAKEQIISMGSQQLEEFLKKNNIQISESSKDSKESVGLNAQQCVFCAISSGKIESYKIEESETALAVLEINPLSKGHLIVIPKVHIPNKEEMPSEVISFSEKIKEKLNSKIEAKKIETVYSNLFDHEIINLVPIYGDETPSERIPEKPEKLAEMQKIILKEEPKNIEQKKEIIDADKENIWLPKRIP